MFPYSKLGFLPSPASSYVTAPELGFAF